MKRFVLVALALFALAGGAAVVTFDAWKIYVPGVIATLRNPVQPTRTVSWAPGPDEPSLPASERPPNIVVIIADDLGMNDVSTFGGGLAGGAAPTPAIDALAQGGAIVLGGYASHATCSPTRAALMTGRTPSRLGFEYTSAPVLFARNIYETAARRNQGIAPPIYHGDREKEMPPYETLGLPLSEITLAEALKGRGYRTLMLGKWHLGDVPDMQPHKQGFDEWLGFTQGAAFFGDPKDPEIVNAKLDFDPIDRFLWANLRFAVMKDGGKPFRPPTYMTDYLGDEAAAAIRANRNRPFFLYLAFNAPHTPLQATRADYDALDAIEDPTLRTYAAMVRALDRNVGKVMAELEAQGLSENTLVVFTSDNGGAHYVGLPELNKPYRGWKATFFEGGVRVPYFVRWPARIPAGTRAALSAQSVDIFSTALAAAGVPFPDDRVIDGVDLLPTLRGEAPAPGRALIWRAGDYRVLLEDGWKLMRAERPKRTWLFNLAADPTEQVDLSAAEPKRVAAMSAKLEAMESERGKLLWPALIEAPILIDTPLNVPFQPNADYVYWGN